MRRRADGTYRLGGRSPAEEPLWSQRLRAEYQITTRATAAKILRGYLATRIEVTGGRTSGLAGTEPDAFLVAKACALFLAVY